MTGCRLLLRFSVNTKVKFNMPYKIAKVTYVNFGPFEQVEVDFSTPGLTTIEGLVEGRTGCDSNGAGKSFLFDGVAWAIYGRCIRERYKGDDVVRIGQKGTKVEVELEGPVPLRIVRYRKHGQHKNNVHLFVDGKNCTRGTNPETDRAIEDAVGMDYLTFANSVAFGARDDIKSFFAAPDAERKRILENILGLGVYAEAEKVARRELKLITRDLSTLHDQVEQLRVTLQESHANLAQVRESMNVDELSFDLQMKDLAVRRLRRVLLKIQERKSALLHEVEDEEQSLEQSMLLYRKKYERYEQDAKTIDKEVADYERQMQEAESMAREYERRIEKAKRVTGECPTCLQKIDQKKQTAIIDGLEATRKEYAGKVGPLYLAIGEAKTRREALQEPEEPVSLELDTLHVEVEGVEHKESMIERRLTVAQAAHDSTAKQVAAVDGMVEKIEAKIVEAQTKLAAVEAEQKDLQLKADMLDFWVSGFGNSGLKSFLIEAEIPEINRASTKYVRKLLGEGATVKLSATKQLKSKDAEREELTVNGSIPGCTESYAGASKGQKKRMDLALVLAFRDIVSTRATKPFGQLFADEIFDGLDRSGVENVADLLKDVAAEIPVALVTHDPRLRSYADRSITVKHKGDKAEILLAGIPLKTYTEVTKRKRPA